MWEGSSVFFGFSSLEDLRFASHGKIRVLAGFRECDSSFRVFLPSSVEFISGFCRCELLSEVLFSTNRHVQEIEAFGEWMPLCRIDIPSTFEKNSTIRF
jgi:hypothetical protein